MQSTRYIIRRDHDNREAIGERHEGAHGVEILRLRLHTSIHRASFPKLAVSDVDMLTHVQMDRSIHTYVFTTYLVRIFYTGIEIEAGLQY
jgi:hypothetical protein